MLGLGLSLDRAGAPVSSYDADADAFFTRAAITDGTQKAAVDALVLSLKSAGLWTGLLALYPYVGGAATPHSHNLRSASYQITWAGTVTHNANGITGDGATGYGSCAGLLGGSVFPHLGCMGAYVRVSHNVAGTVGRYAGFTDTAVYYAVEKCCVGGFLGNRAFSGDPGSSLTDSNATGATKFVAANRSTSTRLDLYVNGSTVANSVVPDSSTPPSLAMSVLGMNQSGSLLVSPTDGNLALSWFGPTLTGGQHTTLAGIVQTFQTTLGRQV